MTNIDLDKLARTAVRYRVLRDIPESENYSGRDVKKNEILYKYFGHTYGCIGNGIALCENPGETPFFEFPLDAVEQID